MRSICKWLENILRGRYIRWWWSTTTAFIIPIITPLHRNLPKRMHMLLRDYLVHVPAKHEYRKRFRDTGHFRSRVPSLEAYEREYSNNGPVTDDTRKWGKCILNDERGYLCAWKNVSSVRFWIWDQTLEGFRLARSIATAPPSDLPYKICRWVWGRRYVDEWKTTYNRFLR